MYKIKLGLINNLTIDRESKHGLYLVTEDKSEDVLLPNIYVKNNMKIGDKIEVFIYKDSQDRIVATTQKPYAMLDEFGIFKVVDKTPIGAFVDWGLPKDLFVPNSAQKNRFKIGEKHILKISYDKKTDRLYGDNRIGKYLNKNLQKMKQIQKGELLIIAKTPLGYKVILENKYEGLIYHNEIFEDIKIGQKRYGYIKKLRSDGKFDISLQPTGEEKELQNIQKIIEILKNDKYLSFNYKSDANKIKNRFEMSKKSFKKALTKLKEENIIEINEQGIKLK